ncbi:peroxisome biogenesis protein 5-like [Gossypium arboreum]|uniref:peroxisome biogenesis protein 5-like n=1 Tax=Gossypium arboreum TaxID=29729 RepID=UPI0022F1BEDF|nr:peroxisome biogenesis protein 5-like [Gossypium arboreum]
MNPYVGHQNPLKEGQELLRKGLLSEAVLALEAEIMKNPENAEGWRLLGITHAENDDDQKVFRGPDHWAKEFGAERLRQESVDDQWVNEFSKLHVDDWVEEFGRQVGEGALGDSWSDNWANSYDEFLSGRTLQGVSLYILI